MVDQQKDDAARIALRLSGTEKQRNDALEALVLQQEIAEELERERKRNKKELSALKRNNQSLMRQKEEAQRVVVHLRSLIDGQAHHMEHIVRSLSRVDVPESIDEDVASSRAGTPVRASSVDRFRRTDSRAHSRASTTDGRLPEAEDVNPDMERRFFGNVRDRPFSQMSLVDVADRHLQDKTDAIADIIRNISEQCAAAVEGLHLARDVDPEEEEVERMTRLSDGIVEEDEEHDGQQMVRASDEDDEDVHHHAPQRSATGSEMGETDDGGRHLMPNGGGSSPYPPTPDLVHRSSTSMSMNSQSTTPERHSQQYTDLPTKIVEDDDEAEAAAETEMDGHGRATSPSADVSSPNGAISKQPSASLIRRPAGARISALGQA